VLRYCVSRQSRFWLAMFSVFAPDSFGGALGTLAVQLICLALSGAVFIAYTLDRPVYVGRQNPRLFRYGTVLRGGAGFFMAACSMCPLLLFCDLLQLSDFEHASGDLAILGLIVAATLLAMLTNVAAIGHEFNHPQSGWQHEAGRIMIPGFFLVCFIGALGCSGRLQDRIMEISTFRI
jgi:hypothetical protein